MFDIYRYISYNYILIKKGIIMTDLKRFRKHVQIMSNGCHEWQSTIKKDGYGQFWYKGKPCKAHKVAYELCKGEVPKGLLVLHKCDNRKCVNPDHLYVGTQKDNVRDMFERGRWVGNSKLNAEKVREIRLLWSQKNFSQTELAQKFGVKQPAIWKIISYRTWKHV